MQAFTNRVKQLEQFVVSQGLQVPLPDSQHASTIDSLLTAYHSTPDGMPSSASEQVPSVAESTSGNREQTRPRNDEPGAAQQSTSDHPSIFADLVNNQSLGFAPNGQNLDLPMYFDADWMLGLPTSDNLYGNFSMDAVGSTAFADLANNALNLPFQFGEPTSGQYSQQDTSLIDGDSSSDDEDHKEVTGQISDRIGTLLDTAKGNWRFYGATSNLHLSKDRQALQFEPRNTSQQQTRICAQLKFLELGHPFEAHLTQHLIKLYFTWQNPSLHIVDRDAFERAQDLHVRGEGKTTFYTEFLVNAMLVSHSLLARVSANSIPGVRLEQLSRTTRVQNSPSLCRNTLRIERRLS